MRMIICIHLQPNHLTERLITIISRLKHIDAVVCICFLGQEVGLASSHSSTVIAVISFKALTETVTMRVIKRQTHTPNKASSILSRLLMSHICYLPVLVISVRTR